MRVLVTLVILSWSLNFTLAQRISFPPGSSGGSGGAVTNINFNSNQFTVSGTNVNIKSGTLITNATLTTPAIGVATGTSVALTGVASATTISATKAFQAYQGSLTHAGTVTLDFDATTTVNSITLTGAVTFATSNLATNRTYRLKITGTSTNATPTFPAWKFLGGAPTTITASKVSMLSLEAWGASDANVVAAWSEEQ